MISPHRPKFWPKTTQPYPFYNVSNTKTLRTGSGRVCYVKKYQNEVRQGLKCWCRKCLHSDSPSNEWWEFYVTTATHVVFDDIEARHTTLRLFYDRNDSPVLIVDKVSVDYVNIEYDSFRLKCVTCDKTLGNKLMDIRKHYQNILEKVFKKDFFSRPKQKLNFIVSHPHGCSKQTIPALIPPECDK
uniref:Uncharacterized protein n=1 Tax=Biomphalaria glabrata TaxID=6526 RepID=A0A2C9L2L1_BIOGL